MLEPGQKGASCKPDPDRPNVLVQILKDWSTQCFKIFTQPGVDTLAKEGENASWGRSGLLLLLFYLLALLADQLSASPVCPRLATGRFLLVCPRYFCASAKALRPCHNSRMLGQSL